MTMIGTWPFVFRCDACDRTSTEVTSMGWTSLDPIPPATRCRHRCPVCGQSEAKAAALATEKKRAAPIPNQTGFASSLAGPRRGAR